MLLLTTHWTSQDTSERIMHFKPADDQESILKPLTSLQKTHLHTIKTKTKSGRNHHYQNTALT